MEDIGVEEKIVINLQKNGVISVIAPNVPVEKVRAVLSQALMNLNDELIANKALIMFDQYITNLRQQQGVIDRIKGKSN